MSMESNNMPVKKVTKSRPVRDAVHKLIRRTPKQARGQQRVDEILDAAERLTRTTSWDKLSTNHIAAEAGIPIGSLYQFFSNKHAIAQALVERYVVSIEEAFASLPKNIETMSPAELVNTIFDSLLVATQKQKGLHAMLIATSEESEIGKISAPIRNLLRDQIERMLAARAPWMSPADRKIHALMSHLTNRAIFVQSISLNKQGDQTGAQRLLRQARIMQIAYYDYLLQEHEAGLHK
jgi:AcrR family transcriptional regulator